MGKTLNQGLVCDREQHGMEAKVESGFVEGVCWVAEWQWCGRLCVGCLQGAGQTEAMEWADFVASGGIEELVHYVIEFDKQGINVVHHLHLHFEHSHKT